MLFPKCFVPAATYYGKNHIILSMDIMEKCKFHHLAVFLHELLHLKRPFDCSVEGCIGRRYYKEYFICEKCSKLLEDIVNGNF